MDILDIIPPATKVLETSLHIQIVDTWLDVPVNAQSRQILGYLGNRHR